MVQGFGVVALIGIVVSTAVQAAEPGSDVADVVRAASSADIVILGEIHDNPEHHATQAAVVAALQPAALVFEMIPQALEAEVNTLREGGATRDQLASALNWAESGWPHFDWYAAILDAAPKARVFGAGQPPEDVRRAAVEGAAAVFGPDAATYGLDRPLAPDDLAAREADMGASHCGALPAEMLAGMVEAQRFRDAGLADAALWARTMTADGRVVVIAGSGHADKVRGMPAALGVANPALSVLAVGQFESPPPDPAAYDLVLLAPAPDREDPCARFAPPGG